MNCCQGHGYLYYLYLPRSLSPPEPPAHPDVGQGHGYLYYLYLSWSLSPQSLLPTLMYCRPGTWLPELSVPELRIRLFLIIVFILIKIVLGDARYTVVFDLY